MKLLTNRTADLIRQRVLDRSPGDADHTRTKDTLGRRPVFVRCTSATAADTSGVGAQCYPGIIVDPKASATTQETGGTVWLTLLGSGGLPKKPKSGVVYECLLTGDVEAVTDDTRARAFAVMGAAATGADCSTFQGLIRYGTCATLSITEVVGACACIDADQVAYLTYDNDEDALVSDDPIYGCPPGVLAGICDGGVGNDGAPLKWNIVVAGFGAPNTSFNQSYTLTHTTGNVWSGTKNGVTVTATRGIAGWTMSISDGGSITVTYDSAMAHCCDTITFDLDDGDGTTTPPATLDMDIATACGNGPAYTPRLERVAGDCGPCLKFSLAPTAGSGSRSIVFERMGCGEDADGSPYAEFASDDPLLCTDNWTTCSDNRVVVRLTCGCDIPPYLFESCPLSPTDICIEFEDLSGSHPELDMRYELPYSSDNGYWERSGDPSPTASGCCISGGEVPYDLIVFCEQDENDEYYLRFQYGVHSPTSDYCWSAAGENFTEVAANTYQRTVTFEHTAGPKALVRVTITGTGCVDDEPDCVDFAGTWNCIPDTRCVEVFDGSGEYASETDCNADCLGGGGGGGGSACPGPDSWSFTLAGFTGCLADLNGTHVVPYSFTSGGVKSWIKLLTVDGFTCYIQINGGLLAGVPYLDVSITVYSGVVGNQTMSIVRWSNMSLPNCCNAATVTSDGGGNVFECPTSPPYQTPYTGPKQTSVSLTPTGACT